LGEYVAPPAPAASDDGDTALLPDEGENVTAEPAPSSADGE
jgi:hypothetical protein